MRIRVLSIVLALFILFPLQPCEAARRRKKKPVVRSQTVTKSTSSSTISAGYGALAKGDANGAIKAWRPIFKSAPGEAVAHALWLQFAGLCFENSRLRELESAAREADSFKATPELRAAARLVLLRAAHHQKRNGDVQKLEKSLDFVRDWQVIGPFSDESGGSPGFDTVFAPERENTFGKTINNHLDKPVRWRALLASNDGSILPGRFLADEEDKGFGVFYAATALKAPRARTVQLRINHSGAMKLWLNGQLVLLDPKQRPAQNLDPDGFVITQKLQAGWNSLLLKISAAEPQDACFSLRLTNAIGADLPLPSIDSKRFIWQPLDAKSDKKTVPAVPQLLQSLQSLAIGEATPVLSFARGFWGEMAGVRQPNFWLWPEQITLQQKAARLAEENKSEEAIGAYQELLHSEEFLPEVWRRLARLQKQAGKGENALTSLRKARALRPQDATVAAEYADLLNERGDKNGALSVYQQSLTLDPSQIFLREKVRLAKGEKSLLDLVPAMPTPPVPTPFAVAETSLPQSAAPVETQTEAIVWLDEARQIVYDDGAMLTQFHQVIQIHSAAAAARYTSLPLGIPTPLARLTVESVGVISAGQTRAALFDETQNTLQFPALKIGDVLDFSYRLEQRQRGPLARQFWTQWFFNLAGAKVQQSRFVLVTPAQMTFNIRNHGQVPAPQRSEIKTGSALWHMREWHLQNLAPRAVQASITSPTSMPGTPDALWIDVSSIPNWKMVADWYRNFSALQDVPDASIKAKALQITQKARTEEDKLRALHAYVARGLGTRIGTPNKVVLEARLSPVAAQRTLRDGYGDEWGKAALLTALCNAVGIRAHLGLFNARSEDLSPFLPAPHFKRAMVAAQLQNNWMWLDATHFSFDHLPAENQGVPALLLEEGVTMPTTTPVLPAESSIAASAYQMQLDATGELKGESETSLSGGWGDVLRAKARSLSAPQRALLLNQISSHLAAVARPSSATLTNLESFDEPLKLQQAYAEQSYAKPENDNWTLQLPWQKPMNIPQAVADESASQTLAAQEWEVAKWRGLTLDTLKLQLPPGFEPALLPQEIKDASAFGRYRFTYKVEGDSATGQTLIVTREVLLTPLRISLEEAANYKVFCQSIARESERKIILKK